MLIAELRLTSSQCLCLRVALVATGASRCYHAWSSQRVFSWFAGTDRARGRVGGAARGRGPCVNGPSGLDAPNDKGQALSGAHAGVQGAARLVA